MIEVVERDARGALVTGARGPVRLSRGEWNVLERLLREPGAVVSRDDLGGGRAADFAVRRLREKVERDPSEPRLVLTVVGEGYRLLPPGPSLGQSRPLIRLRDRHVDPELGLVDHLGRESMLTTQQQAVFRALLAVAPSLVDRAALQRLLGARRRRVDQLVHELRLRLEAIPSEPVHLRTARDGYFLQLEVARSNARAPEFGLLGRADELTALVDATAPGRHVRLRGAPGLGSTAIGQAACLRLAETLSGGAWWASASGTRDEVTVRVAELLRLPTDLRRWPVLGQSRAPTAIVLDGLEPSPGSTALVDALCGGGLRVVSVGRLPMDGAAGWTLGPLADRDGVALFLRVAPQLATAPDAVTACVRALHGSALAIVVAARRAQGCAPDRWAASDWRQVIDDPSLHASLARSFDGLDAATKSVVCGSLVFRAPFSARAARGVLRATDAQRRSLVDASWWVDAGDGTCTVPTSHREWLAAARAVSATTLASHRAWFLAEARTLADQWSAEGRREAARAWPDLLAAAEAAFDDGERTGPAAVVSFLSSCPVPPSAYVGLRDGLLSAGSFPGATALWRREFSLRLREHDADGARRALDRSFAEGLDPAGWPARSAQLAWRSYVGDPLGLDPGDAPPTVPVERAEWRARRGRYLADLALQRGPDVLNEGLALLGGAARDARRLGDLELEWTTRAWLAEARRGLGGSVDHAVAELEAAVAGLDALGLPVPTANFAWRLALIQAKRGWVRAARSVLERYAEELRSFPILALRARLCELWCLVAQTPDRAFDPALEVVLEAESAGDRYGADAARIALATAAVGARRPAGLRELANVREGWFLPRAAHALRCLAGEPLDPPEPLPVEHWVNDVVALAAGRPVTAMSSPARVLLEVWGDRRE